jgi:predicted DNA-binding transcriptional regulator YafY
MFTTATETTDRTLTRIIRAMDHQHPITITYTKADGTETLRTIEVYDVTTTKAGDIVIKAMDRDSGEKRSFRADRISHYTIHRTAYTVPVEQVDAPSGHGLRAATVILTPATDLPAPLVPVTTEQRVNVLAGYLAAA